MKKIIIVLFGFIFITPLLLHASSKEGFKKEDRDRLIRLESKLEVFMHQVDKRFQQVDKRISELREDMNKRFELMDKRFEQVDKRFEQVDKRFEQVDRQFDRMMEFLWIIVTIFTTLTATVIGFAYWDRKTIIRKAKEETIETIEQAGKLKNLIYALKELASNDQKLANVLKSFNLL